ncbi:MAG: DegT/DnrJ/EryC1/StrS family aminotransferase [Fretibacterium sp.]|nr:DegT/DnrJ/EryC1/StrS family aminotransferase [Fretibacterium sp.]
MEKTHEAERLPILDLTRAYREIREEVLEAVTRVFDSQGFILGPEVRSFEEHVESYLEMKQGRVVGCASGTDALLLALMALEVGPGDEVITTPYSFFATAGVVARLGARAVFADIDPMTFNVSLKEVEKKITSRTRVFLPVHLFGQTVPLEGVRELCAERGIAIVEDAAQALGAWRHVDGAIVRAGLMGDVGCYSFFPTKNLGGCGDGGMIVTRSDELAARLLRLRVHGESSLYRHEEVGLNSRLDALQAAVLDVKLRHLERWNAERRVLADRYRMFFEMERLVGPVTLPVEAEGNHHIYHQYVVRVERRDELMAHLEEKGLSTRVYYPIPLHLQPCFSFWGHREGDFPESERLSREALALPIFPGLKPEEQERLVKGMAAAMRR